MVNAKKPSHMRGEKTGISDGGGYALQERDKVKKKLIEPASGNWKARV